MNVLPKDSGTGAPSPAARRPLPFAFQFLMGVAVGVLLFLVLPIYAHFSRHFLLLTFPALLGAVMLLLFYLRRSSPLRSPVKPSGRVRRRLGVIAYFLGWLGAFAVPAIHRSHGMGRFGGSLFALMAVCVALIVFGMPVLSGTANTRLGELWISSRVPMDERELQLRQKALALSCQILIVSTWLAGFVFMWWDLTPGLNLMMSVLPFAVLCYLGLAGLSLPRAILAWNESDSLPND